MTPPNVGAVVFLDEARSSACGDSVRRSGLCREAENAAKAMEKWDGAEQRCSDLPLWLRGARDCGQLALFLVSFLLLNKAGAATAVSRVLTAPVRSRRFCSSFFPRGGARGGVFFDNVCCVCCCPGGEAEEGTPSAPQVSVPSFATSIFGVPFWRLERWPFSLFSFCCWRLFLVSCKPLPPSSVLHCV